MVPVTTMEQIPVLTDREREDLILSFEEARGRIEAGDFIDYDPDAFRDDLDAACRARKSKEA